MMKVFLIALLFAAGLTAQTSTWLGGPGVWNVPANWLGGVPGANSVVLIDGGNIVNSSVSLTNSASVKTIQIDAGDLLTQANNTTLSIGNGGGKLQNTGTLRVDSTGSFTRLTFADGAEIDGGGTIVLSGGNALMYGVTNASTVINRNQTYAGTGYLSLGQMKFENQGTMTVAAGTNLRLVGGTLNNTAGTLQLAGNADLFGATMQGGTLAGPGALRLLDNQTGTLAGAIINNAQIQALSTGSFTRMLVADGTSLTGSGTLLLSGANALLYGVNASDTLHLNGYTVLGQGQLGYGLLRLNNTGTLDFTGAATNMWLNPTVATNTGLIQVSNGATLRLGGTINGSLLAKDNSQMILRGTLDNATLTTQGTGQFRVEDNTTAVMTGKLQNTGTLRVDSTGSFTRLTFADGAEIDGGGTIVLSGGNALMYGVTNASTVINRNQTYAGTGYLSLGQMKFENQGTMTVAAGTNLRLVGGTLNNTAGTIQLAGNADLFGATLQGGTLAGPGALRLLDNQTGTLAGAIINNAQIQALSTGSFTRMLVADGTSLTGSGTLLLSGANALLYGVTGTETLTNSSTIAGNGQLGFNLLSIVNQGTIRSQNGTLTVNPNSGGIANSGTFAVSAGSTFTVTDGLQNLAGTTLTGGTYDIAGTLRVAGANITTNSARLILDGPASQFLNHTNGANALANLATNTALGSLEVMNGRVFTTGVPTFTNAGEVLIGSGSEFTMAGGYRQTGGSTIVDGILSPGLFTLDGGLLGGTGTIESDVMATGGVINPGSSPGKLRIEGDLALEMAAMLMLEIGGYGQGMGYDWLDVTGTATLNGQLSILLFGGFRPQTGDLFHLISWGNRIGDFGGFTGLTVDNVRFDADYRSDGLFLRATRLDPNPVIPEPSTWTMIGAAGIGSWLVRQLRRR